jgi:hypothetical protein
LYWRLAESDITLVQSITCSDWLHWWHNYAPDILPPLTALAFVSKMNEKHKSRSLSAIQVNNQQKTISTEEKLAVISWLEEGEQIVDVCSNVRALIVGYMQFMVMLIELQIQLCQKLKCLCCKTTTVQLEWTVSTTIDVSLLHFYYIRYK